MDITQTLTRGEARALRAYVTYERHEDAAAALGISTQTLKNHLGAIYKKLEVKKAHSAVYALAIAQGHDIFKGYDYDEKPGTNGQK